MKRVKKKLSKRAITNKISKSHNRKHTAKANISNEKGETIELEATHHKNK